MTGSGLRLQGNCNRTRRSCGLAVGLFQGGEQFGLDRGQGRLIGSLRAAQREAGQPRGDLEGAGCLAQGHAFHSPVTDVLEVAYHRSEEFLGGGPFLFAVFVQAARPIGGLLPADGGLRLGLLLQEAGVERLDAVAPAVSAGPALDGVGLLAQLIGDGQQRAALAELEEGEESAAGARGFAGATGEGGWRVEG